MSQPPVTLRFFGGVSLLVEGRPVRGRATQRRRLGVLALLATTPTGYVSRDRIIALLWPEADTDAARHLLAGAVYELRKALGEEAIVSRGDDLALNRQVVDCDTMTFEAALAEGALAQAARLYRGPFADGLHISQAGEFERWLDETRLRYAVAWRKTLASLAEQKQTSGDSMGAAECRVRLAESDRADAAATLQAAEALLAAGEPALALRQCQAHTAHLRRELGADPDERIARLSAQIVEVQGSRPEVVLESGGITVGASPVTRARNRAGQVALWAVAGTAALLLVALTRDNGAHADILPSDRLTTVATEGTASRPALQAWMLGEREYRNGHFLAASEHFARAAESDSNFALAFYRLSQSRLAADLPEADAGRADRRLEQLSPTMPERERLLFSAYAGFRRGNAEYAEQRYQGLTTRFDDDLEAWLQLGETRFHYGPLRGIPLSAAQPAFRRAVALDPGNWSANWHLANLAALSGDWDECQRSLDRLLGLSPEPTQRLELELLSAIARQNPSEEARALVRLRDADELLLFQIAWRTAVYFHDLAVAQQVAGILAAHGRPTWAQMLGRLSLMHLKLAGGDTVAAIRELRRAEALPGTEMQVRNARAAMLLMPGMPRREREIASLRDTVRQLMPSVATADRPGYLILMGLLSAALGQPDTTLRIADQLERSDRPDDAQLLRAEAAMAREDYAEALHHLRGRGTFGWYGNQVSILNGLPGRWQFLRAEALYHTGRLEEALGWYGSLNELGLADLSYRPIVERRRKEILARLSN